jgi:hypothetical protein
MGFNTETTGGISSQDTASEEGSYVSCFKAKQSSNLLCEDHSECLGVGWLITSSY